MKFSIGKTFDIVLAVLWWVFVIGIMAEALFKDGVPAYMRAAAAVLGPVIVFLQAIDIYRMLKEDE